MADPEQKDPRAQLVYETRSQLPPGVLCVRPGPGANCSSAGSAIDILFYGSAIIGALAVALAAALPPRPPEPDAEADSKRPAD